MFLFAVNILIFDIAGDYKIPIKNHWTEKAGREEENK